jgi:hypothetical protein
MTLEERLNGTIDELEEKVRELEQDNEHLRSFLPWTDHTVLKEDVPFGLPVPRLEMVWEQTDERRQEWHAYYRLVYKHLLDDIILVPLGQTRVGGHMDTPVNSDGSIQIPFRDGAHIDHDAEQLSLRAFVRYEDHICEIEPGTRPISMHPWKTP